MIEEKLEKGILPLEYSETLVMFLDNYAKFHDKKREYIVKNVLEMYKQNNYDVELFEIEFSYIKRELEGIKK